MPRVRIPIFRRIFRTRKNRRNNDRNPPATRLDITGATLPEGDGDENELPDDLVRDADVLAVSKHGETHIVTYDSDGKPIIPVATKVKVTEAYPLIYGKKRRKKTQKKRRLRRTNKRKKNKKR